LFIPFPLPFFKLSIFFSHLFTYFCHSYSSLKSGRYSGFLKEKKEREKEKESKKKSKSKIDPLSLTPIVTITSVAAALSVLERKKEVREGRFYTMMKITLLHSFPH
jgi:uncharacterized protein YktB (UPF0637 family)